jgi:hypothetical protein
MTLGKLVFTDVSDSNSVVNSPPLIQPHNNVSYLLPIPTLQTMTPKTRTYKCSVQQWLSWEAGSCIAGQERFETSVCHYLLTQCHIPKEGESPVSKRTSHELHCLHFVVQLLGPITRDVWELKASGLWSLWWGSEWGGVVSLGIDLPGKNSRRLCPSSHSVTLVLHQVLKSAVWKVKSETYTAVILLSWRRGGAWCVSLTEEHRPTSELHNLKRPLPLKTPAALIRS